ncbi:unnamed protein product [Calypogeia fissa]
MASRVRGRILQAEKALLDCPRQWDLVGVSMGGPGAARGRTRGAPKGVGARGGALRFENKQQRAKSHQARVKHAQNACKNERKSLQVDAGGGVQLRGGHAIGQGLRGRGVLGRSLVRPGTVKVGPRARQEF